MRNRLAILLCALLLAGTACHRQRRAKYVRVAPPQVTFEVVDNALKLPGPVVFETNSDQLSPVSDRVLEVVLDYMNKRTDVTLLRIEGHTDSDGSASANQSLSERRAIAVARWLNVAGVDCHRLMPVGFGQTKPIAANDTSENKAQNRRVAFVNASVNGQPVGGASADGGGRVAGDPCN
jgi:OOP family OmpA-OmpF porin